MAEKLKKNGEVSRQGQGGGAPRKYTVEYLDELAVKLLDFAAESPLPLLCSFAGENGLYYREFTQLPSFIEHTKFQYALKQCKQALEKKLIIGGISGKFNCSMVIFTLKNVAGWRDATALEHSGPGGEPLQLSEPTRIEFVGVSPNGNGSGSNGDRAH